MASALARVGARLHCASCVCRRICAFLGPGHMHTPIRVCVRERARLQLSECARLRLPRAGCALRVLVQARESMRARVRVRACACVHARARAGADAHAGADARARARAPGDGSILVSTRRRASRRGGAHRRRGVVKFLGVAAEMPRHVREDGRKPRALQEWQARAVLQLVGRVRPLTSRREGRTRRSELPTRAQEGTRRDGAHAHAWVLL
eukprot:6183645-Pleurochrysis_carterae.AAC.2